MSGLWKKRFGIEKFLVLRRDGTIPEWPYLVMGAADEAASAGLRAYADKAQELGYDSDYVSDVRKLAQEFKKYFVEKPHGNPTATPHRLDNPIVVALFKQAGRR